MLTAPPGDASLVPAMNQPPPPPDGVRPETLLITLTGRDRPGVTSAVFATLARAGVEVVDLTAADAESDLEWIET